MSTTWDEFIEEIQEEYDSTDFVIDQLDHELNVLLERKQAFMSKDINPLVVKMDTILNNLNPSSFGGDYLYKDDWYKNLDLESWGMYKYVTTVNQEGLSDNVMLVDSLGINNEIKAGAELLIKIEGGEVIPRTVESVEWSDYYEKYKVTLVERETTWERKWMPDALYSKCTDPGAEQSCIAYNPCSDPFYKVPIWDDNLPESVESDTIPLKVIYGVGPYTWTIISGEDWGWSLESKTTDDGYNTLYSNSTCDIPVIINVTDYCGNTTDEYTVTNTSDNEMSLSAPSIINQGDDYTISIVGGSAPYYWDIQEEAYITDCDDDKCVSLLYNGTTTGISNQVFTELNVCGTIVIRVKDKCGKIALAETEILNKNIFKSIYQIYWWDYGGDIGYIGTHEYDDPSPYEDHKPYIFPIRCVFSGHFNIHWLEQPKLQELSDNLYTVGSYYDPKNSQNTTAKYANYPECGSLPNEINEQFIKMVSVRPDLSGTSTNVGYDYSYAGGVYNYIYWKNYIFRYTLLMHIGASSLANTSVPGPVEKCAYDNYISPEDYDITCCYTTCDASTLYGYDNGWLNDLDPTGYGKYDAQGRRPIQSALSAIKIRFNTYTIWKYGYHPFYCICNCMPNNWTYCMWKKDGDSDYCNLYYPDPNTNTSLGAFSNNLSTHNFLLQKKICSSSDYIWISENSGDEPFVDNVIGVS